MEIVRPFNRAPLRPTPTEEVDPNVADDRDGKDRPFLRHRIRGAANERREKGERRVRAVGEEPISPAIDPTHVGSGNLSARRLHKFRGRSQGTRGSAIAAPNLGPSPPYSE
jgi:hypothetical protein